MNNFKLTTSLLALATVLFALGTTSGHILFDLSAGSSNGLGSLQGRSSVDINSNDVVNQLVKTIKRLPVTIQVDHKEQQQKVQKDIAEANSSKTLSSDTVTINGQLIKVVQLTPTTVDQDSKEVGKTLNTFADTLKSVTDEDTCDCDPKDSAKSVRQVIDATSKLCQDLLRCLLDSLKKTIQPREATLIRTIVRESMNALSKSVDGIYSIWRTDLAKRDMNSVEAVINGLINVLNKFSTRLTRALSSNKNSRLETVTYVVDSLVNLVANTSEAIALDVDTGLNENQLKQVMNLAKDLAEPLTSSVLAEFVQGTARIPFINKMFLQYIIDTYNGSADCSQSKTLRAGLPSAVLKALAKGLRAMNLRFGGKNANTLGSQAHRNATTSFLLSSISQGEEILKGLSKTQQVSDTCLRRAGESVSNVAAIVKAIIDNITPDIKDPKQRQQTTLTGDLSKDFVDILSVIGANLAQPGNKVSLSTINYINYQQYDILRRVAKNDQAISRDSQTGVQSTISLLVDIARLEIKYVQIAVDRVRTLPDSNLRYKTVRDVNLRIIDSMVTVGRTLAPANNKPLTSLIKGSGSTLAEVSNILEIIFSKQPRTFGDVLYEVFYSLLETERKLVNSGAQPSRSGLPTTVPSDIIYGTCNSIRTTIDWTNALTRSSGLDSKVQKSLISFVVQVITGVEQSLADNENDNKNIDDSVRSELHQIKKQLEIIYKNGDKTRTTQSSIDYYDYSDNSEKSVSSGVSELVDLIQKLDDILIYIIESNLKQQTSIVLRNSETTINVIAVLLEDVSRTPHVKEDGTVILPSGTLKPCTGGNTGNPGVSTTPMPSSPETKPPQTTTTTTTTSKPPTTTTGKPSTTKSPGHHTSTRGPGGNGSTGQPGGNGSSTGRPGHHTSTGRPGGNGSTGQPGGNGSTGQPGGNGSSTGRPGHHTSTRGPGGNGSTGQPGGNGSTGQPGGNGSSTGRPGHHTSTRGPGGNGSTGQPGGNGSSTRRPGHHTSTGRPGGNGSTSQPGGNGSTGQPGGNGSSTRRPGHHTSTRGPGGNGSTGQPGGNGSSTRRPGHHTSTSQPGGNGSTGQPGGNGSSTGRPGHHTSTGRPGGNGSTGQPGGNGSTGQPGGNGSSTRRPGHHTSTSQPGGNGSTGQPGGNGSSTRKPGHHTSTGRPGGNGSTGQPGGNGSTGQPGGNGSTGNPSSHAPNPTTRVPTDGRGNTCEKAGSLDELIKYLLKDSKLDQQDLAKLKKLLEDLLKKSTSQGSCRVKNTQVESRVSKRLIADVIQSLVVRRQAICS